MSEIEKTFREVYDKLPDEKKEYLNGFAAGMLLAQKSDDDKARVESAQG